MKVYSEVQTGRLQILTSVRKYYFFNFNFSNKAFKGKDRIFITKL